MPYNLNLTPIQADIFAYIDSALPQTIIVDGLVETEDVPKLADGSVKPFLILWFRGLRQSGRRRGSRSFAGSRLDSYTSGFDLIAVAANGTDARVLLNHANDVLIGYKPLNAGQINSDGQIWDNTRPVLDAENKPTRWAATARYQYGVFQKRTV